MTFRSRPYTGAIYHDTILRNYDRTKKVGTTPTYYLHNALHREIFLSSKIIAKTISSYLHCALTVTYISYYTRPPENLHGVLSRSMAGAILWQDMPVSLRGVLTQLVPESCLIPHPLPAHMPQGYATCGMWDIPRLCCNWISILGYDPLYTDHKILYLLLAISHTRWLPALHTFHVWTARYRLCRLTVRAWGPCWQVVCAFAVRSYEYTRNAIIGQVNIIIVQKKNT